ncbi:MAG TPA: type II toxin-antitoxin system PemK/MazF family toxin [Bryobacteraceae bacterium]|nr:type II toxin-antitoxin system PemK/MazF family toxin [Bryobacteraceae bacterium]
MTRGELYLVKGPGKPDPRRQLLLDTRFSSVICAPVYSRHDGISTQVRVGVDEGLKSESSIHCDELISLPKSMLTHYVGKLSEHRMRELNRALMTALELEDFD